MNPEPDLEEIRRLVSAAIGTGYMRCPEIIEAATSFLVTGAGFLHTAPVSNLQHTLDIIVDELLWSWQSNHLDSVSVRETLSRRFGELLSIFPKPL